MEIFPVILCGGAGTRLWPASTAARPKPFLALIDDHSLLQTTALRLAGLAGARGPIVVVGAGHADEARRQLAAIGVRGLIIAEPQGRDSGPALLAAALWIARTDPRGVAVAVASDHHIPDGVAFRAGVNAALAAAGQGEIVAFGVKPTHPATAYGYIRPAEVLEGSGEARRVGEFIEKPDTRDAEAFVRAGYLWNSGNLVFRVDVLAAEVAHHAPAMRRNVSAAVDQAVRRGDLLALGPDFALAEAVSIDVAILEKSDKVAVVEIDFAWSDLGSWEAVWAASRRDGAGNAIVARAVVLDSENCLIRAEGDVQIVAVGLKRIAVVVRDNRILVCDLAAGQTLKAALDSLGHGREA